MDAAEWAETNSPARTRKTGCIFCRLGPQAQADLEYFRQQRREGKPWTLLKILPYFVERYGFEGRAANIRDHYTHCIGETWS